MKFDHPRSARLLLAADFAALRTQSRRASTAFFTAQFRANATPSARLGMAVSRRVSKHAVVRNRLRRQIRESFRLQRARLPALDILVIPRTQATNLDNRQLRIELDLLWREITARTPAPLKDAAVNGTMRAC